MFFYGLRSLGLVLLGAGVCLLLEWICLSLRGRPFRAEHCEAACTGMLLSLMLPAQCASSLVIIACLAAIIIGRHILGGRDHFLFPPAAVGWLFVRLCWPEEVLAYPMPCSGSDGLDLSLSAVWNASGSARVSWEELLLGLFRGPMGATPVLLLLVCAVVLCLRRSVSSASVLGFWSVSALFAALFPVVGSPVLSVRNTLCLNAVLLGGLYLIGDRRIAPAGAEGLLYGVVSGLLTVYFTQVSHVENAVVAVSVLCGPLGEALNRRARRIAQKNAAEQEVKSFAKETV